jgi:hypothetical protein
MPSKYRYLVGTVQQPALLAKRTREGNGSQFITSYPGARILVTGLMFLAR